MVQMLVTFLILKMLKHKFEKIIIIYIILKMLKHKFEKIIIIYIILLMVRKAKIYDTFFIGILLLYI